jgi:hypothetical protein
MIIARVKVRPIIRPLKPFNIQLFLAPKISDSNDLSKVINIVLTQSKQFFAYLGGKKAHKIGIF